jgi:hypothetical protein
MNYIHRILTKSSFLHLKSIIPSSLLKFLDKPISVDSYFNVVQKLGLVESAHFAY